ncbi:MAG: inner membrane CreD family protein [bacterium]
MNESKLLHSAFTRMIIIAGISFLLFLFALLIEYLVDERAARSIVAAGEVTHSWGESQTLTGPFISIPYKELSKDENGNTIFLTQYAHFLPTKLNIRCSLKTERRYRGIYEVVLYSGHFYFEGDFSSLSLQQFGIADDKISWKDAFVTMGITDLKGIRDSIRIAWNKRFVPCIPGVLSKGIVDAGVIFRPEIEQGGSSVSFSLTLDLQGSSDINFIPMGEVTNVEMSSSGVIPASLVTFCPLRGISIKMVFTPAGRCKT